MRYIKTIYFANLIVLYFLKYSLDCFLEHKFLDYSGLFIMF